MGRKKKYVPKKWESLNEGKSFLVEGRKTPMADTSATIFESMLRSKAYCDLTDKQRLLYVLCKAQYYGKKHPEKDYEEFEGNEYFYLNFGKLSERITFIQRKGTQDFIKICKCWKNMDFWKRLKVVKIQRIKTYINFRENGEIGRGKIKTMCPHDTLVSVSTGHISNG